MLLNFTVEKVRNASMLRKKRSDSRDAQEPKSSSPVAAIYGDNAAGKSNLLKCMNRHSPLFRLSPKAGSIDVLPVS